MSGEGGKGMKKLPAFARSAGVLLPLFSLPSAYGIGCFSREVDLFGDIAADMGFHWWQVLPLTVIGAGNSPYSGLSTFAGNSLFISPLGLYEDGLITKEEEEAARYRGEPYLVDYDFARENTSRVLHLAFDRLTPALREEMQKFAKEEEYWLEDYALFMALSRERGTEWWKWESGLARRESKALAEAREKYAREVDYYRFEQFVFFRQWRAVLERVHERGVRIIGDLPFYVATDSVDVWVRPSEFVLDKHNAPAAYAGVPPDAFADKGQVWGNCLYDFAAMKKNRYTWWRRRISHCLGLYDALRLDHFRAFYNYFSIPASSGSAADGHWEQGPGQELIDLIRMDNPDALFIAEDLGLIDPDCREFIDNSGIPTMRLTALRACICLTATRAAMSPTRAPTTTTPLSGGSTNSIPPRAISRSNIAGFRARAGGAADRRACPPRSSSAPCSPRRRCSPSYPCRTCSAASTSRARPRGIGGSGCSTSSCTPSTATTSST